MRPERSNNVDSLDKVRRSLNQQGYANRQRERRLDEMASKLDRFLAAVTPDASDANGASSFPSNFRAVALPLVLGKLLAHAPTTPPMSPSPLADIALCSATPEKILPPNLDFIYEPGGDAMLGSWLTPGMLFPAPPVKTGLGDSDQLPAYPPPGLPYPQVPSVTQTGALSTELFGPISCVSTVFGSAPPSAYVENPRSAPPPVLKQVTALPANEDFGEKKLASRVGGGIGKLKHHLRMRAQFMQDNFVGHPFVSFLMDRITVLTDQLNEEGLKGLLEIVDGELERICEEEAPSNAEATSSVASEADDDDDEDDEFGHCMRCGMCTAWVDLALGTFCSDCREDPEWEKWGSDQQSDDGNEDEEEEDDKDHFDNEDVDF